MKRFPPIPRLADAPPELLSGGHLWVQEKVDGAPLRFRVRESGLLVFGDREHVYERDVPLPYRHAARHVRERFDLDAFRAATERAESVVFFGEATHRHAIPYAFDRLPSFLGFDVWSETREKFLPPDAVERAYRGLGLSPVNAFAKELRAIDFDPESYEVPRSAWYDGPAEGVVLRNKNGTRAKLLHPQYREVDRAESVEEGPATPPSPETLARRYVSARRVERVVATIERRGYPVEFDRVYERVLEAVVREEHAHLDDASLGGRKFRSAVAAQVRRHLDGS